jgi:large subunit ribosomal protein L18
MDIAKRRIKKRESKHASIRRSVHGNADRPRLVVRRTLKHIIAQAVDDTGRKSVAQMHSRTLNLKQKKVEAAKALGKALGEKLKAQGIQKIVFDRSRVRAVAEGIRASGIKY